MTRARGRSKPQPEHTQDYLYHATGKSQLDEHHDQLQASDEAQGPPGPDRAPSEPGRGPGWERLVAPPRSVPRATTGLKEHRYGAGDQRGIPGGIQHVPQSPPAGHEEPPRKEVLDEFRGMMAHGVPPGEAGVYQREMHPDRPYHPHYKDLPPPVAPVPVYIVEEEGGAGKVRAAAPRSITCPASTAAEPARVCSLNPGRVKIGLLNEDTATDIRFATSLAAISAGTGALLPWPTNSYTWLETQGELFAIGATGSGTPKLSIIEVSEESGA